MITVPRVGYHFILVYILNVFAYLNKLINYCGPQPPFLNAFVLFLFISNSFKTTIYIFFKASNVMKISGSHITIVSN